MLPQIQTFLNRSRQLEEEGKTLDALQAAQEALDCVRDQAGSLEWVHAQARLARVYVLTGQYSQAEEHASAAISAPNCPLHVQGDATLTLGVCASETDRLREAEELFYHAADIFRQADLPSEVGRALHDLTTCVFMHRGQFKLALITIEEAASLRSADQNDHWGLPWVQAYIYQLYGDRSRTRQALDELLPLIKPGTRVAGGYYFLWARQSLDDGELDKGAEYLRLGMRIATTTGSPDLNIWMRMEYSRFYRLSGEAPVGLSWAEDAVNYARRVAYKSLLGAALIERAQAAWECGDLSSPPQDLREALAILDQVENSFDAARAAFLLAAWEQQQASPAALNAWNEAAERILQGGYAFLIERERRTTFPLLASHLRGPGRPAAEKLLHKLVLVDPPPLRIHGLGQFTVWQGRSPISDQVWKRRKAGELFRFLLLQEQYSASRDILVEALWAESDAAALTDLFHQATSTLRHLLEPDLPDKFPSRYLKVEGDRVYLRLPPGSHTDFQEFEQTLPLAAQRGAIEPLEKALSLYMGELFPMDRYNDWSSLRRQNLEDLYLSGMQTLASAYLNNHQEYRALQSARLIIQKDPWNEMAVWIGMRAHMRLNNAPRALQLYRQLEENLRSDLNTRPSPELRDLADQIRQR